MAPVPKLSEREPPGSRGITSEPELASWVRVDEVPVRAGLLVWGALTVFLYHLLFVLFLALTLPLLLWRLCFDTRYRTGLLQRSGRAPVRPRPAGQRCVWIHGVSVGEVKGAGTLIERLRRDHPDLHIVVSTTTPTGQQVARESYPDVELIYYPLDLLWFPGRALDRVKPDSVLLMELEVWPNFLQATARRHIPVSVINGRISERSFRGYRRVRWLLPQFRYVSMYCVQIQAYRDRLVALGIDPARIRVVGNMKYDAVSVLVAAADESGSRERSGDLRSWLSPGEGGLVLVCGSTHGREDEWLAQSVRELEASGQTEVRLVTCLLYTSPSPRDRTRARMPSSA